MRHFSGWIWSAVEGTAIGLLAAYASRMTTGSDLLMDSVAGASGSVFLAWFVSPLNPSYVGASSFLLAALGAVFLIGLGKVLRR